MNKNQPGQYAGVFEILFSAFSFSTLPIFTKFVYMLGMTPENASILRFFFAFALLAAVIKLRHGKKIIIWTPLVLLQGVALTVTNMFYYYALKYASVGIVTVVFFTHPVLVALLGHFIFKEKGIQRLIPSIVLALAGVGLISNFNGLQGTNSYLGFALAGLGSLSYAIFTLIGQKAVSDHDPLSVTATQCFMVFFIVFIYNYHDINALITVNYQQLGICLIMGIVNSCLAFGFLLKGIQKMGATRASIISMAEPPFSLLLAFLILGEKMNHLQLLGTFLVFLSVLIVIIPHSNKHRSDMEKAA